MNRFFRLLLATILLLLAACDGQAEALPTQMSLDAIATDNAATAVVEAAIVAAATATSDALVALSQPTDLPPTWTVAAPSTQPPTQVIVSSATPVPSDSGTIFFIFNGDSIAALAADGTAEELILVGGTPSELTLSPDGQFLAYTADGANGTREVFITTLDGTVVQAISCLAFARTVLPAWSPDSSTLAFAASQTIDGALGIYTATVAGSRQCPSGNRQRLLVETSVNIMTSLTWGADNTQVFFTSGSVYGVDASTGTLYPPLTLPYGFGPDFGAVYRPGSSDVYYLKTEQDDRTLVKGGILGQLDPTSIGDTFPLPELPSTRLFANRIRFSRDGRFLLASGNSDAAVQDMRLGTASTVVLGSTFAPQAVFSPDGELVAYVNDGAGTDVVPQIWLVGRNGKNPRQLTTHTEGTISDLNWAG